MTRFLNKDPIDAQDSCAEGRQSRISQFRRDEDGGMIIFSLFMFVLILTLAGMAVDLMRFETTRAKLQGTLDRATLAAADLDQTIPPADVVVDYFTKSGMLSYLDGDPVVDEGLNYRVVTANARARVPMMFVDLPRVFMSPFVPEQSALEVTGTSTAEERVTDVEISLVLDVSGSMGRNNRIQNLRPAARDFVTTVLENNTNAPQGLITISMVPYSAVVNAGTEIAPFLTGLERTHEYSTCPLFDTSMFLNTQLNLAGNYDHVAHFDPDWFSDDSIPIQNPWCHVGDHNAILAVTSNEGVLHDAINDLEPYGNTAIDMGVKWGVALLDPSTRGMISTLSNTASSDVNPIADGRPYDFNQASVLKVIVLMTDGSNTSQYDLKPRFKEGLSFVWFNPDEDEGELYQVDRNDYSIQYAGLDTPTIFSDDWFYTHRGSNYDDNTTQFPDGYSSVGEYVSAMQAGPIGITEIGVGPTYANDVINASWQDLYAIWEHNRVNNELLSRAKNNGALPNYGGTSWTWGHPSPS